MKLIDPSEHIFVDSYAKVCKGLGGAVHYCATEHAPDFFASGRKATLVTGESDFGLHLQAVDHPNNDLFKMSCAVEWDRLSREREGYATIQLGPACSEHCNPHHCFSLKTDRFTWATFPEIPENVVRWFTTNPSLLNSKVEFIPFGLNNDGPGASYIPQFVGRPKKGLLYVNFQDNSLERVRLKKLFSSMPWVTYRDSANLPVEQYLAEMAEHKFVLSPPGNGLDCYRTYEAIYLGSVPILLDSIFSRQLMDACLPVAVVQNIFSLNEDELEMFYDAFIREEYDYEKVTLSYWKRRFEDAAQ